MNCKNMQGIYVLVVLAYLLPTMAHAQELTKRPVLHEFIIQILEGHPSLLSAEANLRAVSARARGKSKPIYNPKIEFGYVNNRDKTKEIGFSQTIDWSGKRRASSKVGTAEITAAKTIFKLAKKDLLAGVLQKLTEYQTALNVYAVAEDRTQLGEEFLDLANRRNQAGELPRSELLTAMLALSESQIAMNEARTALSQAKESLVADVGEERESWPELLAVPASHGDLPAIHDIDALPEMILAQNQSEVFRTQIDVAKSMRRPDPTVGVRVGQEGGGSRLGSEPKQTTIGINLSLPLPVWNSYKSEVTAAGEDLNRAQQNSLIVRRQLKARLDASMTRYQSASKAWNEWNQQGAMPLNEQRSLLKKLLEAQEISAVEYLIQLNQTFDVERTSIELNGRLWNAWFVWQNAGGTLEKWLEKIQ